MATPNYEYYGLMVKYWDLLRGDTSKWSDRFFYLDIIKKSGEPVLDVGCSSGRLILDYLSQGIDIDGVDISPEMISLCKGNAEKKNLKPNLYVQSMTELDLPRKYKTILVPSSSIQLLLNPGLPLRAMKRFYDHLESGGMLASPFMTIWEESDPPESEFTLEATRPEDGVTIRRKGWTRFDPETRLEDTRDMWEVIKDGQVIETEVHEQAPATLSYTQTEAVELFKRADFKDVQIYSGFTFDPVKPEDTLFSVTGIKP